MDEMEYTEHLEENEQPFVVDNDQKAEWCLRKKREAIADKLHWKQHYEEQYRKIEEACDRKCAWLDALLEQYFNSVPHKVSQTQESYKLLTGKLIRKQPKPSFEHDDQQLLDWMVADPDLNKYIATKDVVKWSELKKDLITMEDGSVALSTGEIVPGVKVTDRDPVFIAVTDEKGGE